MERKTRNINCKKYDECLTEGAKRNLKNLPCKDCHDMSNFLKPEKVKQVINCIEEGKGIRKTARETTVAKNTVTKIQRVLIAEKIEKNEPVPLCGCGQPAGHKGWCSYRLGESTKRQEFLMKEWGKLTFNGIVECQKVFLEKQKIHLKSEITKLIAEYGRVSAKLYSLEEYLEIAKWVDNEIDEELKNLYIDEFEPNRENTESNSK